MVRARFLNDVTVIDVTSTSEVKRVKLNLQEDHNTLIHRDSPDQHPISAITGLQEALDAIPDDYVSEAELESALLEKQDVISDLATIRSGAALGATAVQPNDLDDYATTQYVDDELSEKQDTLTAGANIQIIGNTISATDTTYTAGTGISITGNVISNTQTSAEWGNITGTLSAQTDLKNELDTLDGKIDSNHSAITEISLTIQSYGNIVTHNVSEFATSAQGTKADTALQPNDNISELTNNVGYITGTALEPYVLASSLATVATSGSYNDLTNKPTIPTDTSDLTNDAGFITSADLSGYATESWVSNQGYITGIASSDVTTALGYTPYNSSNPSDYITSAALTGYATESYVNTADNNLQSQIDAITASSDVTDIVGTYAELQSYDTSTLAPNSIIKVLQDESQNNETTYYRWVITGGVGAWSLIGEEGPYYTISAADAKFATQTALATGLAAKQDVISDLATIRSGASAGATAVQPADLATVATSGSYNDLSNKPIIPTATSDLTNDSGFITSSALTGYATESWVVQQGYITGITSSDVTSALGYTPYNSSNPSGYITSSALAPYVLSSSLATVATSGDYDDLINKPTIPAAQVNSDWNATSGVAQILNKPTIPVVPTNVSAFTNDAGYITSAALNGYATESYVTTATVNMQTTGNLITSISSSSTDTQYPSAKCVYDIVGDIETTLNTIRGV